MSKEGRKFSYTTDEEVSVSQWGSVYVGDTNIGDIVKENLGEIKIPRARVEIIITEILPDVINTFKEEKVEEEDFPPVSVDFNDKEIAENKEDNFDNVGMEGQL